MSLIVSLSALRQTHLEFYTPLLEVALGGYNGHSIPLDSSFQTRDFLAVQEQAARSANIHATISTFPLGSAPVVGERGYRHIDTAALYKNEKRLAIPFVVVATVFFFAGGALCYLVVMPYGFEFLFAFGQGISNPTLMMGDHFSLTIKLLLAFGAIFELPVVSMFLSALGVLTHYTLIKHWRGAIVGSFVLGAVLTPPDVGTQVAMASSLIVLYGLSIIVAWYFTTRRERKLAKELAALAKP